jgi:hypothetical protein
MNEATLYFIKQKYALALLIVFSLYSIGYLWLFSNFIDGNIIYFISVFGRKISPILLLIGFLILSFVKGKGKINNLMAGVAGGVLGFSISTIFVLIPGFLAGIPFEAFFTNGNWNYIPVFEYVIFLVAGFIILGKKLEFNYYSFFLVSIAVLSTGFLYELPVYFMATEYAPIHFHHALFLEPTIIALILLIFMLYFNKVKWGKTQIITGSILMVYSTLLFIFAFNNYRAFLIPLDIFNISMPKEIYVFVEGWLPRIPSFLFLFSLVYGIKKENVLSNNNVTVKSNMEVVL